MLVTILEFAVERFVASDEALLIIARHADYYLALADSGNIHVEAEGGEDYEIILPDLANFRAVLERALADGDAELGMSMAVALEQYWVSNDPAEGERWFAAFFAGAELPPALQARALRSRGGALFFSGKFEEGTVYHRQALAIYRELGDDFGTGHLLFRLAVEANRTGDLALARSLAEESRAHHRGQSPWAESQVLQLLGILAFKDGQAEEAFDMLMQSAELADQVGSRWLRIGSLLQASEVAMQTGRPTQARESSLTALAVAHAIGDRQQVAWALTLIAWAAADLRQPVLAGRLWGALETESARAAFGQWEPEREMYLSRVEVVGEPDFDRGRAEGASLTFDEAVEIALTS